MKHAIALCLSGLSLTILGTAQFPSRPSFPDKHIRNSIVEKSPAYYSLQTKGRGNPWVNFNDGIDQTSSYSGDSGAVQKILSGEATPKAMASADLDEDGTLDLVAGYAASNGGILTIHRGNIDSIHPNSLEATKRKAQGEFVDFPFLGEANAMFLPESVDYVGTGDFDADGHWDVVTARQGSSALYLLRGDGHGGIEAPRQVLIDGLLTSFATGDMNRADGLTDIAIGTVISDRAWLLIFEGPEGALNSKPEMISLPGEAGALSIGQLDDEYTMDVAVGVGSELLIIHGRDRKLSLEESDRMSVPPAVIDHILFEARVRSTALGDFSGNSRNEIVVLLDNGKARLVSLGKANKKVRQSELLVPGDWDETSSLVRAKVSSLPHDDIVFVDNVNHQLHILGGEKERESANRVAVTIDVDSESMAILPMRLNVDALQDLVVSKKGQNNLSVAMTAPMSTFVLNSNGEGDDCTVTDGVCSLGVIVEGQCVLTNVCTLRAAIQQANANPGLDAILFGINSGTQTIVPSSQLPVISSPITIDGTSQPGFSGTPIIELNGAGTGAQGLNMSVGNNTIRGLVINRFAGYAIVLRVAGGSNLVEGNYLGTNIIGNSALGNGSGVDVETSNNTIGGTTVSSRNLISGNTGDGIFITNNAAGNLVQGNYIGTNVNGLADLGNSFAGVDIGINAASNTIGGTAAGMGNIISGNNTNGVLIANSAAGNIVHGNFIGTDLTGSVDLGNTQNGVNIIATAANNSIGGTGVGARNIISGNDNNGVTINGPSGNQIQGNYIGTDMTGNSDLGNTFFGIGISAPSNSVGGTISAARNIISGNNKTGIGMSNNGNQVMGNYIGTNVSGTNDLGNSEDGILTQGNNTIGGSSSGSRNVISGNDLTGILISSSSGTTVQGNYIGTDLTGNLDLGNGSVGISVFSISNGTIVGVPGTFPNVISGNNGGGLSITGPGTIVRGNYIGTNAGGTTALANGGNGMTILSASNLIGGASAGFRNIISGNTIMGVEIRGANAIGNLVHGNYIGTDVTGTVALGNLLGIFLVASNNTIGGTTSGAGNVISGNRGTGVLISGVSGPATGNTVAGNYIGTKANGLGALANNSHGVMITFSASNNTIGGMTLASGNRIQNNNGDGVFVDSGTGNGIVSNSIIGNTGLGIDLGPDGITPNDAGDGDSGANDLQNFPEISLAQSGNGGTAVSGTLNSSPNTSFYIDIYLSQTCNDFTPSLRQGKTYIGSTLTQTNPAGDASFNFGFNTPINIAGQSITATARNRVNNNTSEFSPCKVVESMSISVLNVSVVGQGTVTGNGINCPGDCTQGYLDNPTVEITAGPAPGWIFAGWTGACAQSGNICSLTMDTSKIVQARFSRRIERVVPSSIINYSQVPPVVVPTLVGIGTPTSLSWFTPGSSMVAAPSIDNVKIELSRDGGTNFETIAASTPNDGSECWLVTGPPTTQAVIRVSDVTNPSANGTSDYPFSIVASGANPTIGLGNIVCGSLSTSDIRSPIRGSMFYADRYTFAGTNGQQVSVSLTSSEFDTYLYLLNPVNTIIGEDNNGGGGTNSRIPAGSGFLTLSTSGAFTIEATSALANATGNYTLTLNEPCSFSLSSTSQSFPFTGEGGSVVVSTTSNCVWSAISDSGWIIINSGSSGSGLGTIGFNIAINSSSSTRTGTINVNGQVLTITQLGLTTSPTAAFDFGGDGKADVSVFRPSSGYWYILESSTGFRAIPFGANGDSVVPGDYDGDGKADTAVWRPSNGYWYILTSSTNSFRAEPFGQAGDVPAAADYDGDGKTDIAVYRASVGTFYLLYSSDNSFHFQQWGQAGDLPVIGNYDGDNKSDFAIFRPTIGTFYILKSSDGGVIGQQFGASGDNPIAGDFDGDGKTDIAVYRSNNGGWYWLQSFDNTFRGVAWGTNGDVPSAGDYDGDGKWDVAVFRPSTGTFYILQSTTSTLRADQFGTNGDVPIPSAYVP